MFKPNLYLDSILQITPKLLERIGVCAIILDVDNTIRQYGSKEISCKVLNWEKKKKNASISIVILSNNFNKNVEPVAKVLNLPYYGLGFKPFPFGLKKAAKKLNVNEKQIAVVGDQIFTDIVGGNLQGFKTILIKPIKEEKGLLWKIKRRLEKLVLNKFK